MPNNPAKIFRNNPPKIFRNNPPKSSLQTGRSSGASRNKFSNIISIPSICTFSNLQICKLSNYHIN